MPESTTKQPGALFKERSSRFGVDLKKDAHSSAAPNNIGGG
jgi:hypothetical protein